MKIGNKHGEIQNQKEYDAVIVGGGGHGLATVYYSKKHNMKNIAVVEKGWLVVEILVVIQLL